MINSRNCKSPNNPFTASQWQELEQQALVFRYIVSGVPVPSDLISTVIRTTPFTSPASSSRFFPQQQALPIGWGCFQVGYGRKVDPEPGRCRRTDGKKWRCSKEAYPDSKYCEKHMHRGKSKAKKQIEALNTTSNNNNNVINTKPGASRNIPSTILPSTTTNMEACFSSSPAFCSSQSTNYKNPSQSYQSNTTSSSFYPFLPPHSSPPNQSSVSNVSTQSQTTPLWLLDPDLYYDQPDRHIRYLHEIKGLGERASITSGSETSRLETISASSGYSDSDLSFQDIRVDKEETYRVENVGDDDDDIKKKTLHHFLGDWPVKRLASWVDNDTSRSFKLSTPL